MQSLYSELSIAIVDSMNETPCVLNIRALQSSQQSGIPDDDTIFRIIFIACRGLSQCESVPPGHQGAPRNLCNTRRRKDRDSRVVIQYRYGNAMALFPNDWPISEAYKGGKPVGHAPLGASAK